MTSRLFSLLFLVFISRTNLIFRFICHQIQNLAANFLIFFSSFCYLKSFYSSKLFILLFQYYYCCHKKVAISSSFKYIYIIYIIVLFTFLTSRIISITYIQFFSTSFSFFFTLLFFLGSVLFVGKLLLLVVFFVVVVICYIHSTS